MCARLGGDEFAVLLPGAGLEDRARAHARLASHLPALAGVGLGVRGLALGGATFGSTDDAASLLARADAAMYADKRGSRPVLTLPQLPLYAPAA